MPRRRDGFGNLSRPSILFPDAAERAVEKMGEPSFFPDLNLDQVVADIVAGKGEYRLTPLFHNPLGDVDTIEFRQEVFADPEHPDIFRTVRVFAERRLVGPVHLPEGADAG